MISVIKFTLYQTWSQFYFAILQLRNKKALLAIVLEGNALISMLLKPFPYFFMIYLVTGIMIPDNLPGLRFVPDIVE